MEPAELEAIQGMVVPILVVLTALTLAGLFGAWKRLEGRKEAGAGV